MAQLQFDATRVAPQGDRSPVPEGDYAVVLKTSELKPTPDQTGQVLALGFQITEGAHSGQTIFGNINVRHANPMAQQIGQERLSALCHCVGVLQLQDTTQLHGRPLRLKVIISKQDAKYNDITAFLKSDGTSASTAAAPAPAPAWAAPAPAAPAPAPAPAPAAPAPAPAPFPPQGWTAHPQSPGYFYKGQEVKSEAELRAMSAPAPPAPAPAPAPVYTPPAQPAAPVPGGMPPWLQAQAGQ